MQSQEHLRLQERINALSWHDRAELFCQLSPSFFRAICDLFIPSPEDRTDEQLIEEFTFAFETCPPELVERGAWFFGILNSMQERLSSHTLSKSRYARFADAVSDLLADEHTPPKVYDIMTQAIIDIGNLSGQSAEAFAQQTRAWLPAALEELETAEEVMRRG
jgi:hypothetical protein